MVNLYTCIFDFTKTDPTCHKKFEILNHTGGETEVAKGVYNVIIYSELQAINFKKIIWTRDCATAT